MIRLTRWAPALGSKGAGCRPWSTSSAASALTLFRGRPIPSDLPGWRWPRPASELTGWKIDLYSSREWLERGGEGPLFAPLPPAEELVAEVRLNELKGMPPELVAT